ncbi:MAG: cupin domain-containing protein [Actinomycetes bacterium]
MTDVSDETATPSTVLHENDCEFEHWHGIVSWRTLVSGDRTRTDSLTVGTADIKAGSSVTGALHRHDPPEVYYILDGQGTVFIDDEEHLVSAGSTVFVPGGAWHYVENTGETTLRLLFVFAVDSFDQVHYEYPDTSDAKHDG